MGKEGAGSNRQVDLKGFILAIALSINQLSTCVIIHYHGVYRSVCLYLFRVSLTYILKFEMIKES